MRKSLETILAAVDPHRCDVHPCPLCAIRHIVRQGIADEDRAELQLPWSVDEETSSAGCGSCDLRTGHIVTTDAAGSIPFLIPFDLDNADSEAQARRRAVAICEAMK